MEPDLTCGVRPCRTELETTSWEVREEAAARLTRPVTVDEIPGIKWIKSLRVETLKSFISRVLEGNYKIASMGYWDNKRESS